MDTDLAPAPAVVRRSPIHGWGVFAARDLPSGARVETAPYLPIPLAEWEAAASIATYVFDLDEDHVALGLGCLSLYNHSDAPNASVWFDLDNGVAHVETLAAVSAGAELCISYSDGDDLAAWGIGGGA